MEPSRVHGLRTAVRPSRLRFEEAFTIIRTLLRDGRCTFSGSYYDIDDCVLDPPPARPGGPPLMLGSNSPRMVSIGSRMSTRGTCGGASTATRRRASLTTKATIDAACTAAGRDPSQIEATAAVYVQLGGSGRLMGDGYRGKQIRPLRGDASEIADQIAAFARRREPRATRSRSDHPTEHRVRGWCRGARARPDLIGATAAEPTSGRPGRARRGDALEVGGHWAEALVIVVVPLRDGEIDLVVRAGDEVPEHRDR